MFDQNRLEAEALSASGLDVVEVEVEVETLLVGVDMTDVRSVLTRLEMESVLEVAGSVSEEKAVSDTPVNCGVTAIALELELMELMVGFGADGKPELLRVNGVKWKKR